VYVFFALILTSNSSSVLPGAFGMVISEFATGVDVLQLNCRALFVADILNHASSSQQLCKEAYVSGLRISLLFCPLFMSYVCV